MFRSHQVVLDHDNTWKFLHFRNIILGYMECIPIFPRNITGIHGMKRIKGDRAMNKPMAAKLVRELIDG